MWAPPKGYKNEKPLFLTCLIFFMIQWYYVCDPKLIPLNASCWVCAFTDHYQEHVFLRKKCAHIIVKFTVTTSNSRRYWYIFHSFANFLTNFLLSLSIIAWKSGIILNQINNIALCGLRLILRSHPSMASNPKGEGGGKKW